MNIRNLFSQEGVGVKYADGICANFFKSPDLKATGIVAILLSRDGFKCDPEVSFQTILRKVSSEAVARRCSLK